MNRIWLTGVALGSLLLGACSSVTVLRTREMQKIGDDVKQDVTRQFQSQMDSLRHSLDSLREENSRLQRRLVAEVATLGTQLSNSNDALASRQEEILYRLDMLVGASGKSFKRVVVDKRGESDNGSSATETPIEPEDSVISVDPELEKLYATARADFHKSEYKLAYDEFKQVYEKAKTGEYAENALYWMGLCLEETQQGEKAATVFQRLLDQFPQGKKVCVVLLKMSQISGKNGQSDVQIQQLERLVAQPQCRESNEALRAISLLDTLKGVKP
ncbi:MAG TPA: tetratricopeptide repeat protein [Fibrobacteraceae bacterium]|nr:tetratricopeptide repeat protein [Fibrobacteraceae bacterium]